MVIVKEPSCDSAKVYVHVYMIALYCSIGLCTFYVHVYMCICIYVHKCAICTLYHVDISQYILYMYTEQVCDLVLREVPGSQVVTDVGAELSFILPSNATNHFPSLFDTLEGKTIPPVSQSYFT